jgi:hypothetical protein
MTFVFRLADHGRAFSTRPLGAELRDALILDADAARDVQIDLEGVLAISYSFADEFAGELVTRANAGTCAFQPSFTGGSPAVLRVLDRAFINRLGTADRASA